MDVILFLKRLDKYQINCRFKKIGLKNLVKFFFMKKILHIGANKAVSTTLQRNLFATHSEISYLGEDCHNYADYNFYLKSMVNDDDMFFDDDTCSNIFKQYDDKAQAENKIFIYSNEDIMTSSIPTIVANRLGRYMEGADVLLVIRNQITAIESFYINHGAYLKPAPPSYYRKYVSFDDWLSYFLMFPNYGPLASYMYNRFLTIYSDLFGKEKIHILLFEEYISNKSVFLEKLCNVLNIDKHEAEARLHNAHERQSSTERMFIYKRIRSHYLKDIAISSYLPFGIKLSRLMHNYLESGEKAKIKQYEKWIDTISKIYAADNSVLAKDYNLPLEQYNYPLA